MKIVLISTSCYRKIGGVAQVTWQLAQEYVKKGHEVHVLTLFDYLDNYDIPKTKIQFHRINIHNLSMYEYLGTKNKSLVNRVKSSFKLVGYIIKLITEIHAINPDVVQTNGIMDALPAYISKLFFKIPYTITIHSDLGDENSDHIGSIMLSNFTKKYWWLLPQVRNANLFVALTKQEQDSISSILRRDSVIIPNGVDFSRFYPDFSKRAHISQTYNIIAIGMLLPYKGFQYLIEAMNIVIQKLPQAHCTIIGSGPLKEAHKHHITNSHLENAVTLDEKIPFEKVREYLQSSDVYVLSSVYAEGLPMVLLEAMACGLPIISTPISISPNLIEKWHNGILVPFYDGKTLANAIIQLYEQDKIEEYSIQSLKAVKDYSWDKIADAYVHEFEKIQLNKLRT